MRRNQGLVALLLAAAFILAPFQAIRAEADVEDTDEYADVALAHLIVRKNVVGDELQIQGRNVTVNIYIYNSGGSTASDVTLNDILPEGATLVDGSLETTFPKIASGSDATYSYVIKFATGGMTVLLPPASVSYKADPDASKLQIGRSSITGFYVLTPAQQITRYALKIGAYASLGIARQPSDWRNLGIMFAIIGGVVGANWIFKSFGAARVVQKRKKALAELESSS